VPGTTVHLHRPISARPTFRTTPGRRRGGGYCGVRVLLHRSMSQSFALLPTGPPPRVPLTWAQCLTWHGDLQAKDNVGKIQSLLEESFHCVTRVYTMAEALAAIAKQPFDLFLIDHEPASNESACPLLEIIMREDSLSHIPSIGTSPHSDLSAPCLNTVRTTQLLSVSVLTHKCPRPPQRTHVIGLWVARIWDRI
jgi:hypothetical protein